MLLTVRGQCNAQWDKLDLFWASFEPFTKAAADLRI